MTGEVPRPERDHPSYERLFNVDAMSDGQILNLSKGIYAGYNDSYGDIEEVADPLFYQLALSVRDLASRDPERVKNLVYRCEQSSDRIEQQVAGYTTQALIGYDYTFTRDTLVSVYVGDAQKRSHDDAVYDLTRHQITILMRDDLSPEQIADFNARIAAYDEYSQLEPADPHEVDFQ